MITKYETKQLNINANIGGKNKGDVIPVKVDKKGTIIDPYWRKRMKDSKRDNCVSFVESPKHNQSSKKGG